MLKLVDGPGCSFALAALGWAFPADVVDDGRDDIVLDIELAGVDLIGGDVLEGEIQRHSQCDEHQKLQPESQPAPGSGTGGRHCAANVCDGGFGHSVSALLLEGLLGPQVQQLHRTASCTVDRPPTCGPVQIHNIIIEFD